MFDDTQPVKMAITKKLENGIHLSVKDLEKPGVEIVMVEVTGRKKNPVGFGAKRGWDEVVVTDVDDRGRLGWRPFGPRNQRQVPDCLIIWDLGTYGTTN